MSFRSTLRLHVFVSCFPREHHQVNFARPCHRSLFSTYKLSGSRLVVSTSGVTRNMAIPSAGDAPSFFSRLVPVPRFPAYTGPHKVGTVDVEIPVDKLPSPYETPKEASNIHTIQFRIFYPATTDSD